MRKERERERVGGGSLVSRPFCAERGNEPGDEAREEEEEGEGK